MKAILGGCVVIAMATSIVLSLQYGGHEGRGSVSVAMPTDVLFPAPASSDTSIADTPLTPGVQHRAEAVALADGDDRTCMIEKLRAERDCLQMEVTRLEERVHELEEELVLSRTATGPFAEFLKSWEATGMTVVEKKQIQILFDYCPVTLAPGEALGLRGVCLPGKNWWREAIQILGANRIRQELSAEQLKRLANDMNEEDLPLLGIKPEEE